MGMLEDDLTENPPRYGKRKLDTSELGAVRIDPNDRATRARVVREALQSLAMDEQTHADEAHYLGGFARIATTETLLKLGRLLK